jgi:SAM-dependent methyltransferase
MASTDPKCRLCGASSFDTHVRFPDHHISILKCRRCGLMISHPFPDPDQIHHKYQGDFYTAEGQRFKGWAEILSRFFRIRRAVIVDKQFGPKKAILDVGCGRGLMIHELKKRGWDVSGTQISKTAAAHIHRTLGIDCFVGDLTLSPFPGGAFDMITMWHVMEHLPDPFLYLSHCRRLLKPQGYLMVEVPNAESWSAKVTRDAWMGWDPNHHLYHFTPVTLSLALKEAGFLPLKWGNFSWEYGPFTTLQSFLNLMGQREALFSSLKINGGEPGFRKGSDQDNLTVFAKALLFVMPALLISLISSACARGEVIRVLARPRDMTPD